MKRISLSRLQASPFCCLLLIPTLVVAPVNAQSPVVAAAAPMASSAVSPQPESSTPDNTGLQLRILDGGATEAKVNSTLPKGLTVAVTNTSGVPVADAAVALRLPDSGPTGTFADGSHAAVAYTDPAGQAHFAGLHWASTPGPVALRVTATKATSHAALLLNETLTSDNTTAVQVPAPAAQVPQAAPQIAPPPATATVAVQQPGQPAAAQPIVRTGATPVTASSEIAAAKPEPSVQVTGANTGASQHSSKTKWIILAAVIAAGAGAGIALSGKSKASTPTTNSLTVGTPSVTVGAP